MSVLARARARERETEPVKLPHVKILVDRRDAEIVVNGHKDEADDGIRQQHTVQRLPHGAAAIIQFRGVAEERPDAERASRDRQHHRAHRHGAGGEHVVRLGLLFLRPEVPP